MGLTRDRLWPLKMVEAGPSSDNEKSLADLRDAKLMGRKDPLLRHVAGMAQLLVQPSPGASPIVLFEIRHVFEYEIAWSAQLDPVEDDAGEITIALAAEPSLSTGFREWLTGETGAQHVERRHLQRVDVAYVAKRRNAEVLLVDIPQTWIQFGGQDALVPEPLQGDVKSAQASEKVYEAQLSHPSCGSGTWTRIVAQRVLWELGYTRPNSVHPIAVSEKREAYAKAVGVRWDRARDVKKHDVGRPAV